MLRCGVAPRTLARGSSGDPFFLRAPMRAVICCALPRSRAVYARVCCEKRALARVVAFTRSADPHCSRLFALPYARQYSGAPLGQRSRMEDQKTLCAPAPRRGELGHIDTRNSASTTSPSSHVQPNRKRPARGLVHRRPRNPRSSLKNLQRLWHSLRRRLYARHDAARRPRAPALLSVPSARAVLDAAATRGCRRQRLPERRRRTP